MQDNGPSIIHAVLHLILLYLVHGSRSPNGVQPGQNKINHQNERKSREARYSISKQIADSKKL
jgi:hypothetical protein